MLEKYDALAVAIENVIRTPDALLDQRPQLADLHVEIVREMLRIGHWRPDLCEYFKEAESFETVAGIRVEYMKRRN